MDTTLSVRFGFCALYTKVYFRSNFREKNRKKTVLIVRLAMQDATDNPDRTQRRQRSEKRNWRAQVLEVVKII